MRIWCLALLLGSLSIDVSVAVPLVYTGHAVTFGKTAFADETLPENQDQIVYGVNITRASSFGFRQGGIFNAAQESVHLAEVSPLGTAWAFPFNNPDATLSATNWSELTFEAWETAFGGASAGGPPSTVGQDAVLHLIEQDIYLDIRFTAWGQGGGAGGSFTYERAAITPSADFDRDGDVDGRDFLTWQRGFGSGNALQSQGDANFDGAIDGDDLEDWQNSYGSPLLAVVVVPEPNGLLLAAFSAVGSVFVVRLRFAHFSGSSIH